MKWFKLILLLTICFQSVLFAQNIQELTNITHNRMVVDYDDYQGPINRFNNRLFIRALNKIEEWLISDDGSLDRIYFYETGINNATHSIIDEEKLFVFYRTDNNMHMKVFNLNTTPMEYITKVIIPANPLIFTPSILGNYILVNNNTTTSYKINKYTYEIEGFIPRLTGPYAIKDSVIISVFTSFNDDEFIDYVIRFFDYNTPSETYHFGENIYNLFLELNEENSPVFINLKSDLLYIACWNHIVVYDISQIENIHKVASIDIDLMSEEIAFIDALLYNNKYLICYTNLGIRIYNILSEVEELVYTDNRFLSGILNSLYVYNNKLYINKSTKIEVIDLENNYNNIFNYGNYYRNYLYNDTYLLEIDYSANQIKLSSLLCDNNILYEIPFSNENYSITNFNIINNKLYLGIETDEDFFLDIYDLSNDSAVFYNRYTINNRISDLKLYNDYFVLSQHRGVLPHYNFVYFFDNQEIDYAGYFVGNIGENSGYSNNEYFTVLTNNSINFHDKSNPLNVLYSVPTPIPGIVHLNHINEESFAFRFSTSQFAQIYYFNIENHNFTQTYSYNMATRVVNYYNGIMSKNGPSHIKNDYYSIENGSPVFIGSLEIDKSVNLSYIFPEHNKLILRCLSGIHIYDIEYTVSESDQVVEYKRESFVYPNPVNGGEINFKTTLNTSQMEISIYNVKGQLVKRSKDFQSKDGDMTFSWNKKNEQNQTVASGVYFYKIKTDKAVQTGKFLIVK